VRKKVRLILDGIRRAGEADIISVSAEDPCVVARYDSVGTPADGIKKRAKLDALVAEDVRRGCPAGAEFGEGVADNAIVVLLLERDDLEGNPGSGADVAGVAEVFLPGTLPEKREFVLEPDFEIVRANRSLPASDEGMECDGAVNAA
jgi:hypothetical protein